MFDTDALLLRISKTTSNPHAHCTHHDFDILAQLQHLSYQLSGSEVFATTEITSFCGCPLYIHKNLKKTPAHLFEGAWSHISPAPGPHTVCDIAYIINADNVRDA